MKVKRMYFCCLLGGNLSDTDLLFVAKTRNTQLL